MNRSIMFDYIEKNLNFLAYRIESRSKFNLQEFNIFSESFYRELLNILYDYSLKNLNQINQNFPGVDLIDENNKILIQISSTCNKQKIENSLSKKELINYKDYKFIFLSISKSGDNLKNKQINNPYNLIFEPNEDILDIQSILNIILYSDINKINKLYNLIKEESQKEINDIKLPSNLTKVINVLSNEISKANDKIEVEFVIEDKINYNKLYKVREIIEDYANYSNILVNIYNEFDLEGKNVSFFVINKIKNEYNKLKLEENDNNKLFYNLIDKIIEIVIKSKNYKELTIEELEDSVKILVVDTFMRCKIFEKPRY